MNILVLNGSPRGEGSVTLQYFVPRIKDSMLLPFQRVVAAE